MYLINYNLTHDSISPFTLHNVLLRIFDQIFTFFTSIIDNTLSTINDGNIIAEIFV